MNALLYNQLQLKKKVNHIQYMIQSITGGPLSLGKVSYCTGSTPALGWSAKYRGHLSVGSRELYHWDHSRAPLARFTRPYHLVVHRRSPEVGQGLFPSTASTSLPDPSSASELHLHRKPCQEAICGYSIMLCPLQ